jgi:hypothetical protein
MPVAVAVAVVMLVSVRVPALLGMAVLVRMSVSVSFVVAAAGFAHGVGSLVGFWFSFGEMDFRSSVHND